MAVMRQFDLVEMQLTPVELRLVAHAKAGVVHCNTRYLAKLTRELTRS
jgi:hypothetical protein